jgi:hypothetical protein
MEASGSAGEHAIKQNRSLPRKKYLPMLTLDVLSIITIENGATLVSSSDDRRIFLVNIATG